jgi:uncharacterized OsmC-like protein
MATESNPMNADELRALQAPLKERYRDDPATAVVTMHSTGTLDGDGVVCRVRSVRGDVEAGLHPAAGGDGTAACSGDMLLDALVGCAGVTLRAVATAMGVPLRGGTIRAEADADFRGTLGIDRSVPVGVTAVRLVFDLDAEASDEQLGKLIQLTERYCVVYQTLVNPPAVTAECTRV